MSHRYSHNSNIQEGSNKYLPKTQKKFVAKNQSQNPFPEDGNPKLTSLSSSLRQSDASSMSSTSTVTSGSRVRMGENGDRVSIRAADHDGGNFLHYLPQDEAVAAGLGAEEGGLDPVESQRVVDLLNRELSRLLKLKPRDFWREVASNSSLHGFLDSFLQFRSRWYDFPRHGAKGIVAGVIVGEFELSRRVFMVLYRISSNRDPGARPADSLSPKDHAVLLQEKGLLDFPKLLDICAIYGHENEDLTKSLVEHALNAQPGIHDNLTAVLSHFLSIFRTMHQRCCSSLETLYSGRHEDHKSSRLHTDFLEVMDFINDAIVSLDAFVTAYKPAAVFFSCPLEMGYGNEELLLTLSQLHDSLLPSLLRGFQVIFSVGDDAIVSDIAISLKMLSMRIVKFGWKLLDLCYLSDELFKDGLPVPTITKMFPANIEDPIIRADVLVEAFRQMNGVSMQILEKQNRDTFLQDVERNYDITGRLRKLQSSGWVVLDDEQFQYLSGIMMHSQQDIIVAKEQTLLPTPVVSNKLLMDEDAAVMESKISQIKDLFPDYGKGFLAACLEVYNQNPEEVIQRILEGTLHKDLQLLDTSLETVPIPKSASTVSGKDKGKGKLIETTTIPSNKSVATYAERQTEGPSVSSSTMVGRFIRKSKDEVPDHVTLDGRSEKDVARATALISQYEYEDEYDDSFDDLGLNFAESGLEETEILSDKINSKLGAETEFSAQPSSASKWGSRKKPQFYVKDGRNYGYKVAGSVAVANANEAALVSQAQQELIHGLGRGGNLPLGAVKRLTEYQEQDKQPDTQEMEGRGNVRIPRGRGRRGGAKLRDSHGEQDNNQADSSEVESRGNMRNQRGRGRMAGGRNHYRKDRATDFPQQKLTIIGWADPEKIVKAIRKTRKIATICSHTEAESAQPTEQAPESSQPAPDASNPPPSEPLAAEVAPPAEAAPPADQPPPENPPAESAPAPAPAPAPTPAPGTAENNAAHQTQPCGPRDVGEVHVIYPQPPNYGFRYGYAGHWNRCTNGPGLQHEQTRPIYVTHSYNTYRPSPYLTEYDYIHSPPRHTHYSRIDHYNEDYHSNNSNGNITAIFSDENPNACRIM